MLKSTLEKFKKTEQYQIVERVFADNFGRYRNRYLLAFVLMVIASLATSGSAWLMKDVINSILDASDFDLIATIGILVIVIFVVKGFATYGFTVILASTGNRVAADIQKRVFNHLLSLKTEYFDRTTHGEIFTRANLGIVSTRTLIETFAMTVGRDLVSLVALCGVMVAVEPAISLSVLVIGPAAFWFVRSILRKTRMHAKQQLMDMATSTSLLKETISGIMLIKTYSLEKEMSQRMDNVVEDLRFRNDRIAKLAARMSPLMESLGGITIGLLVIYAGWWVINGDTQGVDTQYPGKLMAFITAFFLAYAPAKKLANLRVNLEKLYVDVRYMYDLLDNQVPESRTGVDLPKLIVRTGDVEIKNLQFSYGPELPVLNDVNLCGCSGEKIGLVGASGSGKSTIFKLMMALYQPKSGQVLIDGQNVFEMDPHSVRDQISYVGQESHIFTGSVAENIAFGKLDASEEEIEAAAKLAHAHGFISKLPDGYQTFVGENGAQLSGGQRQRIAIARAFLKDAPIVLLDEATSALDTKSEQAIQGALEELVEGKTTFIIAHRLSTVQKCDRIYVVNAGQIVEQGSHDQLLETGQNYAQLFRMQYAS